MKCVVIVQILHIDKAHMLVCRELCPKTLLLTQISWIVCCTFSVPLRDWQFIKLAWLQGSRSSAFSPARAVSVVAVVAHKVLVLVGDIDEQKVQPLQLRLDLVVAI